MNKEDLKQYKMNPQRVKELTGVEAELYVFTFQQLQEVVKNNAVLPLVSERACNNCRNLMVNKTAQYIYQKYWCALNHELTLTNTKYVCDNWESEHVR